ncbi:MAG: hypothetical protein FWG98_02075 [Candidatus Cloacimonetes bacterium]|nr:hypothetical protein [Candidatus Cloacimonadota bacterium]
MIMIIIAMILVSTPIILMLYFSIKKTLIYMKTQKITPKIPSISSKFLLKKDEKNDSNHLVTQSLQKLSDKEDEEITAVITAAINMYLRS